MSTPITPAAAASTGLSIADEAHAPAAVRNGSAAVKQAYASAQSFEEMLMQQLSQSMLQSSGLGGEGSSEGEGEESSAAGGSAGAGGMLTSLLPQALTEGVMREGGLGLASQLMSSLDPAADVSAAGGSATNGSATGATVTGGTATGGTASLQGAGGGEAAGTASLQGAGGGEVAGTAPLQGASGGEVAGAGPAAAGRSVEATGGVSA